MTQKVRANGTSISPTTTAKSQTKADVLVIGAGLSGLRAASAIQAAGLTCLVIEALDRVGGKTLSLPSSPSCNGEGVVDVGAAWINDTNQSRMFELAKQFGLGLEIQRAEGKSLLEDPMGQIALCDYGDFPGSEEEMQELLQFMGLVDSIANELAKESFQGPKSKEIDQMTLEAFCKQHTDSIAVQLRTSNIASAFVGTEANEISALYFLRYIYCGTGIANMISDEKDGGQYIRIHEGTQSFAKHLAQTLSPGSIILSTPVISIEQLSNGRCLVKSSNGAQFTGKKVVVSLPTTLYPSISFTPELPPAKKALGENTALGYYSKMILVFDKPWWRTAGLSGVFESAVGPALFARDTCVPALNQYSISCFLTGEPGRQWSKQSMAARRTEVLSQFNRLFKVALGGGEVPEPINVIEYEWSKQQWFLGAPSSVMAPGVYTSDAGKVIKDVYGHIHFVGTETSDVWEGYMEGAVRSGERGAAEVIQALN